MTKDAVVLRQKRHLDRRQACIVHDDGDIERLDDHLLVKIDIEPWDLPVSSLESDFYLLYRYVCPARS